MAHKPEERPAASETVIVSGTAVVIAAGLFEWLVISPEHPGHALLSVIASSLAATLVMALLA